MARVERLSTAEDNFWRALMRITLRCPAGWMATAESGRDQRQRVHNADLSEAPGELRMRDLAIATALSASRTTRLVASSRHGLFQTWLR